LRRRAQPPGSADTPADTPRPRKVPFPRPFLSLGDRGELDHFPEKRLGSDRVNLLKSKAEKRLGSDRVNLLKSKGN
jgi:hypothetical protein